MFFLKHIVVLTDVYLVFLLAAALASVATVGVLTLRNSAPCMAWAKSLPGRNTVFTLLMRPTANSFSNEANCKLLFRIGAVALQAYREGAEIAETDDTASSQLARHRLEESFQHGHHINGAYRAHLIDAAGHVTDAGFALGAGRGVKFLGGGGLAGVSALR